MRHALIALLLVATCGTTGAQSLGRLFYSEAERAQLEQQRGKVVQQASAPRPLGALRHDGVVMRSAGPATWFVNGNAVPPQNTALPAGTRRWQALHCNCRAAMAAPSRCAPASTPYSTKPVRPRNQPASSTSSGGVRHEASSAWRSTADRGRPARSAGHRDACARAVRAGRQRRSTGDRARAGAGERRTGRLRRTGQCGREPQQLARCPALPGHRRQRRRVGFQLQRSHRSAAVENARHGTAARRRRRMSVVRPQPHLQQQHPDQPARHAAPTSHRSIQPRRAASSRCRPSDRPARAWRP
jgi:hypothetical protein